MDSRGFLSIEYLFFIFIILVIATGLLFISHSSINSAKNIEKNSNYRMKLNEIANDINQVNSHGKGYSKIITLPPKIAEKSYSIVVTKNCVMLDDKSIRAKSDIIPFNLVNENDKKLQEFILYSGGSYLIKSQNDSKILIKRIG